MTVAAIIRRIDAGLANMDAQQMKPRAIYLTRADHEALARARTKRYRQETGSTAFVWPCSYEDVLLVNMRGVEAMVRAALVPVREGKGSKGSCIYSVHGVTVSIPKRAPK